MTTKTAAEQVTEQDNNGWFPIETAPKDGTFILLFTAEGIIEGYLNCFGYYDQCVCHSTYDGAGVAVISCKPSHWRPLINPPKDDVKSL